MLFCLPGAPSAPGCLAASGRQAHSTGSCRAPASSAEPPARFRAAATVRCVKTLACSDRSGRAASVAPWPALPASRQAAGCKGQRRFAHALSVVAAGPCSLPAGATHPYELLSPGHNTPQPAALTVQGNYKIFYPKTGKKFCVLPRTGASGRGSDAPCGEGSQTGEVHTTGNTAAGSRETSKPRLPTERVMFFKNQDLFQVRQYAFICSVSHPAGR